ncbi:hypothetical protein NPIL_288761 [Nephila pilipes]|uniref:Uncharacterized protein n=1 Tax=Nephila pilipes TaxID=299642 RepID=A0A8X6ULT9_NEPPI|nr:hypothetical protein NPIL_288761 [Nephila pilipes]
MSKRDRLQIRVKWCNDEYKQHWLRALENRIALESEQITINAKSIAGFFEKHGTLNKIVKYVLNAPVPFNVRDFQTFISNEYEKEINEADGEVRTILESFNPWRIQP